MSDHETQQPHVVRPHDADAATCDRCALDAIWSAASLRDPVEIVEQVRDTLSQRGYEIPSSREHGLRLFVCDDGGAFDGNPEPELARILRDLADKIEEGIWLAPSPLPLIDVNGNRAGEAVYR